MNWRTVALTIVVIISIVAAIGFGMAYRSLAVRMVDDSGEPAHKTPPYIIHFREAKFKDYTPANRQGFVDALGDGNVVFRHSMVIIDQNGCDSTVLKNTGLINPKIVDPCLNMGQQVTQRVGLNNKDKLREALSYLDNTP
jgi:hypothetical protein